MRAMQRQGFGAVLACSNLRSAVTIAPLAEGGMHYLFTPKQQQQQPNDPPPVVLISGTAQTISGWIGHTQHFHRTRDVLQYETRGQGRHTTLPLQGPCDLYQHASDFLQLIRYLQEAQSLVSETKLDIVGFSFGARVALAIAARYPELVRSVVLTGVAGDRGALGRTILKGWRASLAGGNLDAFIWQSVTDGHSGGFLARNESRLDGWVESAVRQNRAEAIKALVDCSHFEDPEHPQHTVKLAQQAVQNDVKGFLIGAEHDRIAPANEVKRLGKLTGWPCTIVENAGHSAPIEQPKRWRSIVDDCLGSFEP